MPLDRRVGSLTEAILAPGNAVALVGERTFERADLQRWLDELSR